MTTLQSTSVCPDGMSQSEYAARISYINALQGLIVKHKVLRVVCPWGDHGKLLAVFRARKAEHRAALSGHV